MKGLIFTYLMTFGGAAAALWRPYVGLLIYVSFSILKPDALWYWSVPEGNYSRIVAVALIVGWVANGFGTWQFGRGRGVVLALAGYWLWAILSASFATVESVAWDFVLSLSKIALPFLVGVTLIDSAHRLKQLVWVIVLSQGYLAAEFNRDFYSDTNTLRDVGFAAMDNNSVAIALVTCSGLAFFLGVHSARWWQKCLAFGAAALMVHAVLFSNSRGGMLALGVTGLVSFALIEKRPKHLMIFAAAAMLVVRLAGPEVRARLQTSFVSPAERDASAVSRTRLWADCWDSMIEHPVLGVGPDNWPLTAPEYGWPSGKEGHTLWLQIGAELGFPGLACLVAFYGLCLVRLWPIARGRLEVCDPSLRHLAQMVIAALSGFALAAQFVSLESLEVPYYVTLVGAGVLRFCQTAERSLYESPVPSDQQFTIREVVECQAGQLITEPRL